MKHPLLPVLIGMQSMLHKNDARAVLQDEDYVAALIEIRKEHPDFQPLHAYTVTITTDEEKNSAEVHARYDEDQTPEQRLRRTADQLERFGLTFLNSRPFNNDLIEFAHANPGVQLFRKFNITPRHNDDGVRGIEIERAVSLEAVVKATELIGADGETLH